MSTTVDSSGRASLPCPVCGTGGGLKAQGELNFDELSATVTGKISRNRVVGPNGTDRFTFPEAGHLQTFPAKYPWYGKDISQQIGNAVPPRLGMRIISVALGLGSPSEHRTGDKAEP
ncbi:DNA cytosine methyltransferase [Streptomyces sp. NPDC016626]|uniref:DNA cytosine methyltransferase n=1 Tax=Streptomyces sp. NPDC016626 TaxID=3364968 RepID=UPI0036F96640